jgi:hypothetical protein
VVEVERGTVRGTGIVTGRGRSKERYRWQKGAKGGEGRGRDEDGKQREI